MSQYVIRKFTSDSGHIYVINNGIISRKSIVEFLAESPDAYTALSQSGKNIGWCNDYTSLMFTEDDEIYRVAKVNIPQLVNDDDVYGVLTMEKDIVAFNYPKDKYPDKDIIVDRDYKDFDRFTNSPRRCGTLELPNPDSRLKSCVLVHDALAVYSVCNGDIFKENIIDFIAGAGIYWMSALTGTDETVGYTYNNPDFYLRITDEKIEIMNKKKAELLINHCSTKINVRKSSLHDFLYIEYDDKIFTDVVLGVITEYK